MGVDPNLPLAPLKAMYASALAPTAVAFLRPPATDVIEGWKGQGLFRAVLSFPCGRVAFGFFVYCRRLVRFSWRSVLRGAFLQLFGLDLDDLSSEAGESL